VEKKLFAVYVGGLVEGAHVELHDMRFVIGRTIEDCFDDLKAQWWGAPESLHIDAFGALEHIDGFRIDVVDEPAPGAEKLWFFNLGGYDPAQFTELHENVFVVAPDWRTGKKKALERVRHWTSPHKDYVFDVERAVDVAAAVAPRSYLRLTPGTAGRPFRFEARYIPLARRSEAAAESA
jgi:hypothetical protein